MNVMLDLETFGTRPGSVIVSIGAVAFDEDGLGEEFSVVIDAADAQREGLTIDASTIYWWLSKSKEAREGITFPAQRHKSALESFTAWLFAVEVDCNKRPKIWGNGASFDCALLAEAYERCGMERPWRYTSERCYRTLAALRTDIPRVTPAVAHNALDDARAQAEHAVKILRAIAPSPRPTAIPAAVLATGGVL